MPKLRVCDQYKFSTMQESLGIWGVLTGTGYRIGTRWDIKLSLLKSGLTNYCSIICNFQQTVLYSNGDKWVLKCVYLVVILKSELLIEISKIKRMLSISILCFIINADSKIKVSFSTLIFSSIKNHSVVWVHRSSIVKKFYFFIFLSKYPCCVIIKLSCIKQFQHMKSS